MNRLSGLFGVSPDIQNRIAEKYGGGPLVTYATPPNVDPDSAEAWEAAGAVVPSGNYAEASNPYSPRAVEQGINPAASPESVPMFGNAPSPGKEPPKLTAKEQKLKDEEDAARKKDEEDAAAERDAAASGQAAPTPGYMTPAGWQHATQEATVAHGISKEALEPWRSAKLDAAIEENWANKLQGEVDQERAGIQAGVMVTHAMAEQQAAAQMNDIARTKQQYISAEQDKFQRLVADAQGNADPDAYWKERGPGGVMAALSVALGAFGASLTGGQNAALQIVQGDIDRNIRAQEQNLANKRHAVDMASNLYAQNLAAFGDRERAVLATKAQYYAQVDAMAQAQAARLGTKDAEIKLSKLQAALAEQRAADEKDFVSATEDRVTEHMADRWRPAQMVGGGGTGSAKALENTVTLSDGTTAQFQSGDTHKDAIKQVTVLDKLTRMNQRALSIRKELRDINPVIDRTNYMTKMGELEDLEEEKSALLSSKEGQGVLRDNEYLRKVRTQTKYTQGFGWEHATNPLAYQWRDSADNNLRAQNERMMTDQHGLARSAGARLVKKGYVTDAQGNLVPVGKYTGQDVQPTAPLAPRGFKPMDASKPVPTMPAPLTETTPAAPNFGRVSTSPPSIGGTKKGRR